jgi:hypothetical protein
MKDVDMTKADFFEVKLTYDSRGLDKSLRVVSPASLMYEGSKRKSPKFEFDYVGKATPEALRILIKSCVSDRSIHAPLEMAVTEAEKEFLGIRPYTSEELRRMEQIHGFTIPSGAIVPSRDTPNKLGYAVVVSPVKDHMFKGYELALMSLEGAGLVSMGRISKELHIIEALVPTPIE